MEFIKHIVYTAFLYLIALLIYIPIALYIPPFGDGAEFFVKLTILFFLLGGAGMLADRRWERVNRDAKDIR